MAALALSCAHCAKAPTSGELTQPSEEHETESIETLRIVTFNAWVVPFRSDHDGIAERIGRALGGLDAHVVALQEVWREQDARDLAAALRASGFGWVRWRASQGTWAYGSPGLMLASKLPMRDVSYVPYRAGTMPIIMWHPDWYSGKGYLSAEIELDGGPIRIVTTHAQADYATNGYDGIRLCQMLELGRALSDTRLPLVVAGDLNVREGEAGHAALLSSAGLQPLQGAYGVDAILFRSGEQVALAEASSRSVLEGDAYGSLSDHKGILASIDVHADDGRGTPPAKQRTSAKTLIEREMFWLLVQWLAALATTIGCIEIARRQARALRRSRVRHLAARKVALGAATLGAIWSTYYAFLYVPAHASWLQRVIE